MYAIVVFLVICYLIITIIFGNFWTGLMISIIALFLFSPFQFRKHEKWKVFLSVYITILVAFLLFFHVSFDFLVIFPKATPTFHRTVITSEIVEELIEKRNNGNMLEMMQVTNDPLYQQLKDREIIITREEE